MEVELRNVAEITPYENNPRINDQAVAAVAASIREFGFRQPIVVDELFVIIVGDTRLKAALKLGLKQVPVHVAKGLTPEQIRAYRIADNQTNRLSDWDTDRLIAELKELEQGDYDLTLLGFSADDLEALLDDVCDGLTDPDEIPEPPEAAITEPGDLWLLGDHRLLCADAGEPEDV